MIRADSGLEEGHCGLVPLGGKCSNCTTTGLRWNLGEGHRQCVVMVISVDNHCMELGGVVSTNNLLASDTVTVDCTDPLLFTMSHKLCT